MAKKYFYELKMKVRDYECDIQGVVNNANYQHYMEHTRHEFLETTGISFAEWNQKNIAPMVAKVQIEYKKSLKCGDEFTCRLYMKRDGARFIFFQDIYRCSDNVLCAKGIVDTIIVVNGKLSRGDEFEEIFAPYMNNED